MFKKKLTFIVTLILFALLSVSITQAQSTKINKIEYPIFALAILGGVQFPVGGLNDAYNPSFNAGLDINLRLNRETSLYINGSYFNLPRKGEVLPGGDVSYIAITAGPRYIFTNKNLKAQFFMEAGLGAYIKNVKEYTAGSPSVTFPSVSTTVFGINTGPGVIIPLANTVNLKIKSKLHYTFEEGGAHTFISAAMGLDFQF